MYIRGFDGLRALAILLVFLMHHTGWAAQAQIGYAGVWLFFVLSGFLITGQLRASRTQMETGSSTFGRELLAFWLKRAFRIFPAYYVLLLLVVPFYLLTGREVAGLPWYSSYLSNFYFQMHPSEFMTTFAHFWSLAVEEQFYLLFAPLMLLIPFRRATAACLALIAASVAQRFGLAGLRVQPYAIYIDSLVNFGLLASGALLFMHRDRLGRAVQALHLDGSVAGSLAFALLVALVPLAQRVADLPQAQLVYLAAGGVAVLLVANVTVNQTSGLVSMLEWTPLAWLGRVSYGLYLYNDYVKVDLPQRALQFACQAGRSGGGCPLWLDAALAGQGTVALVLNVSGVVAGFLALLLVAALSWRWIEQPALRVRKRVLGRLGARPGRRGVRAAVVERPSASTLATAPLVAPR